MTSSLLDLAEKCSKDRSVAFKSLSHKCVDKTWVSVSLLRLSDLNTKSFKLTLEAQIHYYDKIYLVGSRRAFSLSALPEDASSAFEVNLEHAPFCIEMRTNGPLNLRSPSFFESSKIQFAGDIKVRDQHIEVGNDTAALQDFLHQILCGKTATLGLRNAWPEVYIPALRRRERIGYSKDAKIQGMGGPVAWITDVQVMDEGSHPDPWRISTTAGTDTYFRDAEKKRHEFVGHEKAAVMRARGKVPISVTLHVSNPSPLQLQFGCCRFEIQTGSSGADDSLRPHEIPHRSGSSRRTTTAQATDPFQRDKEQARPRRRTTVAVLAGELDIRAHDFEIVLVGWADMVAATSVSGDEGAGLVGLGCCEAIEAGQPEWCDNLVKGIDTTLGRIDLLYRALGMKDWELRARDRMSRWNVRLWGDEMTAEPAS